MISTEKIKKLKLTANKIRQSIIEMLVEAGSGHSAGPLGMADIFTALYFEILKHDPKNPAWPDRDKLVLSNGHICPVLYATMAHAGYFPIEELKTLRKFKSRLQGHPHRDFLPMVETSSGPLGSGLSQAAGMALADRLDKKNRRIFCLMSDGEIDCGQNWEAIMFCAKEKLASITAVIDRNNIQLSGVTEEIMPLEPLSKKIESFGWNVVDINGHDFSEIIDGLRKPGFDPKKPTMIIAHTIPGKGVSFMEGKYQWHGIPPNKEQAAVALGELKEEAGKILADKI
ncbi:MAG: transketolase [Candidatus Paceibacterota bacterium]|jgi:transketolase